MIKYFTLILIFLISYSTVCSQKINSNKLIKGKVTDKESCQPVEFASVVLRNATDSTIVSSTITRNDGSFKLEKDLPGPYFIQCSFIGYETTQIPITESNTNSREYDVGTIELSTSLYTVGEVEVIGEKSILNNTIDKRIYNVGKDLMGQSGSVTELLQNIPSVNIDIDGNVTLRGSKNVMILTDGELFAFNGTEGSALLQQMSAASIDHIEVITNPSVKYSPDGTSGIINIVSKKDKGQGFKGSFVVSAGNQERYNASLQINYGLSKISLYGNYCLRRDHKDRYNDDSRILYDDTYAVTELQENNNTDYYKPLSNNFNIGADFKIDSLNKVSLSLSYNNIHQLKQGDIENKKFNPQNVLTYHKIRNRRNDEYIDEGKIKASWRRRFTKHNSEIEVINLFRPYYEKNANRYINYYLFPELPDSYENKNLQFKHFRNSTQINYTRPFNDNLTLETGYNAFYADYSQSLFGEISDDDILWQEDTPINYHFNNKQNIQALYFNITGNIDSYSYSVGIRPEYSSNISTLTELDSIVSVTQYSLYPSIKIKRKFSKEFEVDLSYNKRINRPGTNKLNPFPEYRDPFNLRTGNPWLLPEIVHNVELGAFLKLQDFSLLSTAFYRNNINGITEITEAINDSTWLTTPQNLASDQSAGIELIGTMKISRWFNANISGNVFYNQIDASNLGLSSDKSAFSWNGKVNATFRITPTTSAQLNYSYYSQKLTPQGYYEPRTWLNIGFRQDLFRKKASLTFTVSDVFNSMSESIILDTPTEYRESVRRRTYRVIYLGFSYRFGENLKSEKDNPLEYDDKF